MLTFHEDENKKKSGIIEKGKASKRFKMSSTKRQKPPSRGVIRSPRGSIQIQNYDRIDLGSKTF